MYSSAMQSPCKASPAHWKTVEYIYMSTTLIKQTERIIWIYWQALKPGLGKFCEEEEYFFTSSPRVSVLVLLIDIFCKHLAVLEMAVQAHLMQGFWRIRIAAYENFDNMNLLRYLTWGCTRKYFSSRHNYFVKRKSTTHRTPC